MHFSSDDTLELLKNLFSFIDSKTYKSFDELDKHIIKSLDEHPNPISVDIFFKDDKNEDAHVVGHYSAFKIIWMYRNRDKLIASMHSDDPDIILRLRLYSYYKKTLFLEKIDFSKVWQIEPFTKIDNKYIVELDGILD